MPKVLLLALPLLLLAAPARAADVGFIDLPRALRECSDGKKAIAETRDAVAVRQKAKADHEAAVAAAKKDKKPAPPALAPTDEQWEKQQQQREQVVSNAVFARMQRIFPALVKARKLAGVQSSQAMLYVAPPLDLTDELVQRLDRGEGGQEVAVAPDLKAENAALKARLAALEKRKGAKPEPAALPNLDPRALTATRPSP